MMNDVFYLSFRFVSKKSYFENNSSSTLQKKLPNSIILLKNSGTTDQENQFIKH